MAKQTATKKSKNFLPMLNEMIEQRLDDSPVMLSKCELGPGKKASVGLIASIDPVSHVYLFAECYLPARPKNAKLGWGLDEIVRYSGAYINLDVGSTDPRKMWLETISIDEFKDRFVPGKVAQIKLDRCMEGLERVVELDEEFVTQASTAWNTRDQSIDAVGGPRYLV